MRLPLFQRGIEGDLEILPNPPLAKEGTEISPSPSLQKRGTSSQKTITHKEQGLKPLYQAFTQAKKRKKPSYNRLMFEQDWLSHLFTLLNALQRHTWRPLPSVCFVAKRPKAREIHAPDFADRVVHHWLVPQLEAIYEPVFIYDSFANRKHKGTHAAVSRLQDFVRQVHSGQGGGYYLQLDIHNFFNSIHRPTLYGLLKAKIHPNPPLPKEGDSSLKRVQSVSPFVKGGLRGICNQQISPNPSLQKRGTIQCKSTKRLGTQEHLLRTIHALLRQHPKHLASHSRATPQELALVPAHKQLKNAAKGCGLPIGNLSSQFFANVYLNELDQFVKHTLKAKRY
ncbi:MAG TPA: reverse transcriptase domain-containing protein, partial [Agitococcus sp.]|nr:reverse transcriptase domain-containing protein [Agitococcus sp.]